MVNGYDYASVVPIFSCPCWVPAIFILIMALINVGLFGDGRRYQVYMAPHTPAILRVRLSCMCVLSYAAAVLLYCQLNSKDRWTKTDCIVVGDTGVERKLINARHCDTRRLGISRDASYYYNSPYMYAAYLDDDDLFDSSDRELYVSNPDSGADSANCKGSSAHNFKVNLQVQMPDIDEYASDDGSLKTFEAAKYAAWTKRVVPIRGRWFQTRPEAWDFVDKYTVGSTYTCYYRPGKESEKEPRRIAMVVGGDLPGTDSIEGLVSGIASFCLAADLLIRSPSS
jgi:hypothetical protein